MEAYVTEAMRRTFWDDGVVLLPGSSSAPGRTSSSSASAATSRTPARSG